MSWIQARRVKIQKVSRRVTSFLSAFVVGTSSLFVLAPAAPIHALDQPTSVTINKVVGADILNTELLTGTVTDEDGVQALNVTFLNANTNVVQSVPTSAVVSPSGMWSLQLSKDSLTIQPSLSNPSVKIQLTVTDMLDNQTSINFGAFNYTFDDAQLVHNIIASLSALDPADCAVAAALQNNSSVTVFGPNNEAIRAIPAGELQMLLANPDELCAVIATHIIAGRIESSEVTSPVLVTPENPGNQPLTVEPKDGSVVVNTDSTVVNADNNVNGTSLLHVINALINPHSNAVDIDDVYTNNNSPELHGTVENPDYLVTVRIDGVSYDALNNGDGTWTIPAGVVTLDPAKSTTLFSVVARRQDAPNVSNPSGLYLVGITLRSNMLHPATPGMGAGTAVSTATVVSAVGELVSVVDTAISSASAESSPVQSTPAETPSPTPAPAPEKSNNDQASTAKASTSQWYWWLIGIATLGALYYILGGSSTNSGSKK